MKFLNGIGILIIIIILLYLEKEYSIFKNVWVVSLSISIVTALITQFINNALIKVRDKHSFQIDQLKFFYFKAYMHVSEWIYVQIDFKSEYSLQQKAEIINKLEKRLYDLIYNNLTYVNNDIYQTFKELNHYKHKDDLSSFNIDLIKLNLYRYIVEENFRLKRKLEKKKFKNDYKVLNLLLLWELFTQKFNDFECATNSLSFNFYFNENMLKSKQLNKRLKTINLLYTQELQIGKFNEIIYSLIEGANKKEIFEAYFDKMNFREDSMLIGILENKDTLATELSIFTRKKFRSSLLSDYYEDKYNNSESVQKYSCYPKEQYKLTTLEFRNAVEYLYNEGFLNFEIKDDIYIISITSKGESYHENKDF